MPASYPLSVRPFTTKVNVIDIVDASHPNSLQEEVVAIESTIGLNPALSTSPSPTGTFISTSTQFNTLNQRLANIEIGIISDSHSQYVKRAGNDAITNTGAANVGLVIRGAASQTASLQEWRTNANVVLARVTASGTLVASSVDAPEVDHATILGIFGA
jgi:hypothetical protein